MHTTLINVLDLNYAHIIEFVNVLLEKWSHSVFQIESLQMMHTKVGQVWTQRLAETIFECIFEFIYDEGKEENLKEEKGDSFSLFLEQRIVWFPFLLSFFLIIYLKNHRMVEDW